MSDANFMERQWLEKNCPGLLRDIEFWSAEGAARARAGDPSRDCKGAVERPPGSPSLPARCNCFSCLAPMKTPGPENLLPWQPILCNECVNGLGEEGMGLLRSAVKAGWSAGANEQGRYDSAVLEAAQTELSRVNQSVMVLLKQAATTAHAAKQWEQCAYWGWAIAAFFCVAWLLTLVW